MRHARPLSFRSLVCIARPRKKSQSRRPCSLMPPAATTSQHRQPIRVYDGLDEAQPLEPLRTTSYLRSLAIDETLGFTNPDGTFYLTADALAAGSRLATGRGVP